LVKVSVWASHLGALALARSETFGGVLRGGVLRCPLKAMAKGLGRREEAHNLSIIKRRQAKNMANMNNPKQMPRVAKKASKKIIEPPHQEG
jgi:hypothetical protein